MVSMVYRGILPWFIMIYQGLPVSKYHAIPWHLPWYIFIRVDASAAISFRLWFANILYSNKTSVIRH